MGKPYSEEMADLGRTLMWAESANVERLVEALASSYGKPLLAVGSGGSLTACYLMSTLHRRLAGQPARVGTPLEILQENACQAESTWFISSGGSNADILNAFAASVQAEPRVVGVLCANASSPLARAAESCSYCELASFELPTGPDGFLATNSLMAFCVLLVRAYESLFSGENARAFSRSSLMRALTEQDGRAIADDFSRIERVLARQTLIVLHGAATRAAAYDVESRFTEAALGCVQTADYRNFAHGRHHWLAKHGGQSGVVAFVGPEERALASSTLAVLPEDIPTLRIELSPDWHHAALEALVVAQRLAQWAGHLRKIDPGQPGVPPFGHLIYELHYDPSESRVRNAKLDDWKRAVIERKAKQSVEKLLALAALEEWLHDFESYQSKLRQTIFAAVVFDYDGTLVGPTKRTEPPEARIAQELTRLLEAGMFIGIATGRGVSVRKALRAVLQQQYWPNVIVGYYNGAEISPLCDDTVPNRDTPMSDELSIVARELRAHRELGIVATQTDRSSQITLEPRRAIGENVLWRIANDVISTLGIPGVRVVRSSHSADVLAPGVSKRNVVGRVWELVGKRHAEPLCIGDRGCWPGNDFELLSGPHSLSVDEVGGAADRCWNFARAGTRGVDATKEYLVRLRPHESGRGLAFKVD